MDETEYILDTFAQVTLDANGRGNAVNIGPVQSSERWEINGFSANGSASGRLQIMRGNSFSSTRQLDITDRADSDSSETSINLRPGETVSFWWTNGTSGATMTCTIRGSRFLKGRRSY